MPVSDSAGILVGCLSAVGADCRFFENRCECHFLPQPPIVPFRGASIRRNARGWPRIAQSKYCLARRRSLFPCFSTSARCAWPRSSRVRTWRWATWWARPRRRSRPRSMRAFGAGLPGRPWPRCPTAATCRPSLSTPPASSRWRATRCSTKFTGASIRWRGWGAIFPRPFATPRVRPGWWALAVPRFPRTSNSPRGNKRPSTRSC